MMYWTNRIDELLTLSSSNAEELLKREYQRAYKDIEAEIMKLYNKISRDGTPTITELYRYDRYYKLMGKINSILSKLGKSEQRIINQQLTQLYLTTGKLVEEEIGAFSVINKDAAKQVVNQVWCADGKVWSDRIWAHKAELQEELSKGLMNTVVTGRPADKLSQYISERFGVGLSQASRIVRTEMNNVQTQAAKDRYIAAGFTKYQVLATIDSRTSKKCKNENGKVYLFSQYLPGMTAPPFHPNCRSTIIPKE